MSRDFSRVARVYLHRLVKDLIPAEQGSDYLETVYNELLDYIQRSTQHQRPPLSANPKFEEIIFDFRPRFESLGDESTWLQFQNDLDMLVRYTDQEQVISYLNFLNTVINGNTVSNQNAFNDFNDRLSAFDDIRSMSGYGIADSFENINFDRFSDKRSIYSSMNNNAKVNNGSRNYTLQELVIPYFENHVPEDEILKYISYTLVGTNSNLFPLKPGEISIPDNVDNSESGLLHFILEAAIIYKELKVAVETFKNNKMSSQIKTAFLSFVSEELNDYMKFINILSTRENYSLRLLYGESLDFLFKLRFMYFLTKRIDGLRGDQLISEVHSYHVHGDTTIRRVADDMFNYITGPFITSLKTWIIKGELNDRFNEFFVQRVNAQQSFDHSEIFIDLDEGKIPDFLSKELSNHIYMIGKMVIFLKIYCNEVEWINEFQRKYSTLFESLQRGDSEIFSCFEFKKIITIQYNEIINFCTYLLETKYNLTKILKVLKYYLLMGKGDFIENIISNGEILSEPSTMMSGYQLTKLLQNGILKTSARFYLRDPTWSKIIDGLDARLLEVSHGNIGWDVFTLDYRIESPLSLVLNDSDNNQKKEYLRIFSYLWKIKRIEHLFQLEWKFQKNFRFFNNSNFSGKKLRKIRLIQDFLVKFIKNVESFIFQGIIEEKFNDFFFQVSNINDQSSKLTLEIIKTNDDFKIPKGIMRPGLSYLKQLNQVDNSFVKHEHGINEYSIDELKEIHRKYLSSITKHKLINGSNIQSKGKISNKFYITQLNNLINLAFKFVSTLKEFYLALEELSIDQEVYNRCEMLYENSLGTFHAFNGDLKEFVGDLIHDDELELRYFGNFLM